MKIEPLAIQGAWLCKSDINSDNRGFLVEWFKESSISRIVGHEFSIKQGNISKSSKGVFRGLHYQMPPHAQGKLVRVIEGEVLDIVVDIRQSSPTCGQYITEILSGDNKKQLYIPEGFAHGFLTLSKTSELLYKTTDFYHPESERSILWNDPTLNIKWPENLKIELSPKDL